jgi:hypothetical protein
LPTGDSANWVSLHLKGDRDGKHCQKQHGAGDP